MSQHLPKQNVAPAPNLLAVTDTDGKLVELDDVTSIPGLFASGRLSIGLGEQTGTIAHGDAELTAPYLVLLTIEQNASDPVLAAASANILDGTFDFILSAVTSTANYALHWRVIAIV